MEMLRNIGIKMKMIQLILVIAIVIVIRSVESTLNPAGTKCGQKQCSTVEYCSPFDQQCRPCSNICDANHRNHDLTLCVRDCQEYLHDQRYVTHADLGRDGNLRDEMERLSILVKISLSLTIIVTIVIILLLLKTFCKLERLQETLVKVFGKKWRKNTNKVRNDVENNGGTVKAQQQNNTRLIMPTISANVAPSTQSSNGCSTTNTLSTTASIRQATEDNTLEFAYDNPAMSPSPDTSAQQKSKRESSF